MMMILQLSKANHSQETCLRYDNYKKLEAPLLEAPFHKLDQHHMEVHFLESSLEALADVFCSIFYGTLAVS